MVWLCFSLHFRKGQREGHVLGKLVVHLRALNVKMRCLMNDPLPKRVLAEGDSQLHHNGLIRQIENVLDDVVNILRQIHMIDNHSKAADVSQELGSHSRRHVSLVLHTK